MASCRPLVLAALVAVGLLIGAHGTPGYAQSTSSMTGTPSTDPLAGITSETLGSGVPGATPGQTFELARVTFAPGATIPLHTNPGAQLVSVLSGELTLMATQAGGQLMRPEAPSGTPAPPARSNQAPRSCCIRGRASSSPKGRSTCSTMPERNRP